MAGPPRSAGCGPAVLRAVLGEEVATRNLADPVLNDVLLSAAGCRLGGTLPLPYAGGSWVVWDRCDLAGATLDGDLPLRPVPTGDPVPLAAGRQALGWWLTGTGRAMLSLARSHALDRIQFGRRLASFQAVALVLDGLLGGSGELTREGGTPAKRTLGPATCSPVR